MANEQNLTGKGFDERTAEEQREIARAGGIASGKARREKADMRKILERLLEEEVARRDKNGKVIDTVTTAEGMILAQIQKAMRGDTRAFEVLRDTAGQKPVEKVMIAEVDQNVIDEIEKAVYDK